MGNKVYRLFEYAYLAMAVFSVYIVISNWDVNRNRAYLFAFFGVVAVFMFFFKRKFRRKIEEHNRNKQ